MRVPQPYLINPVDTEGEAHGSTVKGKVKVMAKKRRKLAGAALAAYNKKRGIKKASAPKRKRRKSVKASRPGGSRSVSPARRSSAKRKRHMVKQHNRRGGAVHGYKRHGALVHAHMSNPYRRRSRRRSMRNPQLGSVALEGLMAAGIILGSVLVVGYANGQLGRFSKTASGWGNLAGKLAIALGAAYGAHWASRKGYLSRASAYAVTGAAFAPLVLAGVASFAPQIAGRVTLANEYDDQLPENMGGGKGLQAQLNAELNDELEAALEREETESSLA
jgi:hypothetical protein